MEETAISNHSTGVSTAIWNCAWDGFFSLLPWIDSDYCYYPPHFFQFLESNTLQFLWSRMWCWSSSVQVNDFVYQASQLYRPVETT